MSETVYVIGAGAGAGAGASAEADLPVGNNFKESLSDALSIHFGTVVRLKFLERM